LLAKVEEQLLDAAIDRVAAPGKKWRSSRGRTRRCSGTTTAAASAPKRSCPTDASTRIEKQPEPMQGG
jgi:hypothetical protein